MTIFPSHSLTPFHTFGLPAQATHIIAATTADDLLAIWRAYPDLPKLVLGEGSNVVFCADFAGVVVLNQLRGISVQQDDNHWLLQVGGGENWHQLVTWAVEQGINGLENLALIPGLVGSAPIQNIGAYGVEFKDVCQHVDVLDLNCGKPMRLDVSACQFGYRDSIFKHEFKENYVVIGVGLRLAKTWQPKLEYGALAQLKADSELNAKKVLDTVCQIRRAKLPDPRLIGNAGSFFKNPVLARSQADEILAAHPTAPIYQQADGQVKLAAGWLIDKAGLKGYRCGNAAVHRDQALVLINQGGATIAELLTLAQHVVATVQAQFGVALEPEVRFMGQTAEVSWAQVCQNLSILT